jgi:tetratricopeptide (TPR) repeat protein
MTPVLAVLLAGAVLQVPATPSAPAVPGAARKVPALDSRLNDAFRLIKGGRYAEARLAAEAYLTGATGPPAHPGHGQFILALSYHRQRLYESARGHFARAVALEPGYVTAWFFYGFTLLNLGRLDEARAAFETYLAGGPEDPEAVFGLGLVALEQDRVDDAERSFLRATALAQGREPGPVISAGAREDLSRYAARMADVHLRRGDLQKARAELERSVELWPAHFEPWHKLAVVLRRLGDEAAADRAQARSDEAFRRRTAPGQP